MRNTLTFLPVTLVLAALFLPASLLAGQIDPHFLSILEDLTPDQSTSAILMLADQADIQAMRVAGVDDRQNLEIDQVVAYFAHANPTVLGLGVNAAGDMLGLSPDNSENPDDWSRT